MANHKKRVCLNGHDTAVIGRNAGNRCRQCAIDYQRAYNISHSVQQKASVARWAVANKHRTTDSELRRTYGITLADKQRMFDVQSGKCLICPFQFKDVYSAHTDHNHKTGKVRGLLCDVCNRKVLPVLELYYDRIAPALKYLEQAA